MCPEELESKISELRKEFGGLLDDETLRRIAFDERELTMPAPKKTVAELKDREEITIELEVTKIADIKEFEKRTGGRGRVRNLNVRDESGNCRLALWDDDVDLVEFEYTHSGAYITHDLGVPTVLVEHDIAYRSAFRGALMRDGVPDRARALFDVARLYRWEIETARKADVALTASNLEAEMLRRRGVPQATSAVPNGVDVAAFEPRDGRREVRDILFVGYFLHPPNVDGLNYFVSSIWPHLCSQGRHLSVTVVGTGLAADLASLADAAGFRYTGFVHDLTAELWSHRVFVCPIRYGAGTRIKLLEAAAARCAIVSTTLGAEGLGLRDGRDALLADDPAAFARAVLRLLDDDKLRARLGDSAHDTVQRQFDWPVLAGNLERIFYDLLESR